MTRILLSSSLNKILDKSINQIDLKACFCLMDTMIISLYRIRTFSSDALFVATYRQLNRANYFNLSPETIDIRNVHLHSDRIKRTIYICPSPVVAGPAIH